MPSVNIIYHITSRIVWESQQRAHEYFPTKFTHDGFVHACLKHQIPGVLKRYFQGKSGLLLLSIDERQVEHIVKYEPGPEHEDYPHVYGGIPRKAVVAVEAL